MSRLTLRNIGKSFGDTEVLKAITLDVEDGEFLSLVGQSGCGKSTLLRIISGLEAPSSGEILMQGQTVTHLAPKQRNIAMVFQDYALYPHMSVAENMAMPLIMAQVPMYARLPLVRRVAPAARRHKPNIDAQIDTVAKQLRIDHLLARKPAQLSGGQRQRVALGRALVRNPGIFLMDEPLSNLDAKLRVEVRREISELHASSGLTFVYVTHDQTEAMTMSDRVALMQGGSILQVAAPNSLYTNPASVDVARFIGSPQINIFPVQSRATGLHLGDTNLGLILEGADADLQIGLRPEALSLQGVSGLSSHPPGAVVITLPFDKHMVEDLGPEVLIHGRLDAEPEIDLRIRAQKAKDYGLTDQLAKARRLNVTIDPTQLLVFDAGGRRLHITPRMMRTTSEVS
ncbi:ABC transporter ATP-binding protein [Thalassovita taeanensis]|uniref:Carbohydrate ABC transporter ATP-binding protein, CUT1 family (TC 3.A.1.1.-) n=1 Tax=Thalassovita taeanensis TaxID=657014 RepID=A0A1H9JW14_9RHOB|nr:ABC transporter ATP-binding protein [Thalassovita taeanensis]SEQ91029.1 carbohydrate ABC transporter ATP-binding protein, CUT1 family (TC 3.A.1.1.-) [Thalassovita taeanensis]